MPDAQRIKEAYERNRKAISLRPSIGQGTAITRVRVRDGMTCEIQDGRWTLTADEDASLGGNGAGPDPGVLGRAALGSCLAIGYAMSASLLGVPVAGIDVEVQADYDARGMFDVDDSVPAGWGAVRYIVRLESSAAEADVMRVVEHADRHSSFLYNFTHALPVSREVQIAAPAG